MKKEQLSPEEQIAENAVKQMEHIIDDVIDTAYEIKDTLYASFDYNKPERWPDIVDEAQSALCSLQIEMKLRCRKIKKRYTKD